MSLHEFERTLLGLYSGSRELRARRKNVDLFLSKKDLTPFEARAIRDIPIAQLTAFQEQLHRKSLGVARQFLRSKRTAVLMSLHPHSPVLVWGPPAQPAVARLSPGAYQLLHRLSRLKVPLTPWSVLIHSAHAPLCTGRDVLHLARTMAVGRLFGFQIKIPLVL